MFDVNICNEIQASVKKHWREEFELKIVLFNNEKKFKTVGWSVWKSQKATVGTGGNGKWLWGSQGDTGIKRK